MPLLLIGIGILMVFTVTIYAAASPNSAISDSSSILAFPGKLFRQVAGIDDTSTGVSDNNPLTDTPTDGVKPDSNPSPSADPAEPPTTDQTSPDQEPNNQQSDPGQGQTDDPAADPGDDPAPDPAPAPAPDPAPGPGDSAKDTPTGRVVGYFEDGWKKYFDDSFPVFKEHVDVFDEIVPFWHTLGQNGEIIVNRYRKEVVEFAHAHGVKVVPLINNEKNVVEGNSQVYTNPTIRKKAVASVVALVDKYGYDGVNLDFEQIPKETAPQFTEFIKMLAAELHPRGKIVSVSVFPKVDVPERTAGAHDYETLKEYADELIIMAYPHHWSSSAPGSLAPYEWVDRILEHAVSVVPREKIVIALPLYGYDWPQGGHGSSRPTKGMMDYAIRYGADIHWDNKSKSPYFFYWANGVKHEVWFDNSYAVEAKLKLAIKHGVSLGFWRVGFEYGPRLWDVVRQDYLGR